MMKPVQIGTSLMENDETTAIYNKYSDWFEVHSENEWLTKYIVLIESQNAVL